MLKHNQHKFVPVLNRHIALGVRVEFSRSTEMAGSLTPCLRA